MLGLFGTLDLGARSLQTQRLGVEVAGHNIANVNNPDYARQRLVLATSVTIQTELGPQGSGAEGIAIIRLRSELLDRQIQNETSVSGYLEAQQLALQFAQTSLGQAVDRQSSTSDSTASTTGQHAIGDGLNELFSAFQSLSTDPSSVAEREVLLMKAADLASRFNLTDQRLQDLANQLDASISSDCDEANDLLSQIASLNDQISKAELGSPGGANDLRDLRQAKIEELSKLTAISIASNPNGTIDVSIAGTTLVSGLNVAEKLEAYDAGGGQILVRAQTSGTPLAMTGGSLGGTIDVRDGEVKSLRQELNALASTLMTEINAVHRAGYDLNGGTGLDFFTGTGAADIQVNSTLLEDPSRLQLSGVSGASGNNQVALQLAQLAGKSIGDLKSHTFAQAYGQTVASLGQSLASTNTRLDDQSTVRTMLANQRDSVSGVSLDEEMTNLMKFQKAYEASARLITVVGEMLDALLNAQR
jgi:flagellar hook-associated protein 1